MAEWIAFLLMVYGGAGLLFGLLFVSRAIHSGTLGFRIIILPAAAALWPLLAMRWAAGRL